MASKSSDQCYYKRYGEMEEEKAMWRQKERLESHSHKQEHLEPRNWKRRGRVLPWS